MLYFEDIIQSLAAHFWILTGFCYHSAQGMNQNENGTKSIYFMRIHFNQALQAY